MKKPSTKEFGLATQTFVAGLKTDKELRRAYNDNIAMAFKDNYGQYKKETGKKALNREDIHIVANRASDYFLRLLCDEIKYPEGR